MTDSQITGANDGSPQEDKIRQIIADEIANLKKDLISPTDDKINLKEEINSLKNSLKDITDRFNESDLLINQKIDTFKNVLETSIRTQLDDQESNLNKNIQGLNAELTQINNRLNNSKLLINKETQEFKNELETLIAGKLKEQTSEINREIEPLKTDLTNLPNTIKGELNTSVTLINKNTDNSKTELKEYLLNAKKLLDVLLSYKLLEEANKLTRKDRIQKVEEWRKTVASFKKLINSDDQTQDINSIISELLTTIDTNLSHLIKTWEELPKKTTVSPENNKDAILKILGLDSKKN